MKNSINKAINLLMNNNVREPYTIYINENYPDWFIKEAKDNYENLGVVVRVGKGY